MIAGLGPAHLLDVWERAYGTSPARQGLVLLQAALPDLPPERLAGLSVGQRDLYLLLLREATFGRTLAGYAQCPQCREGLEMTLAIDTLYLARPEEGPRPPLPIAWRDGSLELLFRLPDSDDLLALEHVAGVTEAQAALLERCLLSATVDGTARPVRELPEPARQRLVEQMEAHDPQANIELLLSCTHCGHQWTVLFDIVSYLWREVDNAARRTVREVHALAAAYGWRERDVLALSPWRRQLYLRLVGAA
jgi:hypothetical protein